MIDVGFRHTDPADFTFTSDPTTVFNPTPNLLVYGSAWPSGTKFDVYALVHLETMAELDTGDGGDDDEDAEPTVADAGTMESVAKAVAKVPAVITSGSIVEALDNALGVINGSLTGQSWMGSRTGFGGRAGGRLVKASSNVADTVRPEDPASGQQDYLSVCACAASSSPVLRVQGDSTPYGPPLVRRS